MMEVGKPFSAKPLYQFKNIWVNELDENDDFVGHASIVNISNSTVSEKDYIILVKKDFYKLFTKEEQEMILYHEYGHFWLRGCNKFSNEIETDFYMYMYFGKTKVINLLKKFMELVPGYNEPQLLRRIAVMSERK